MGDALLLLALLAGRVPSGASQDSAFAVAARVVSVAADASRTRDASGLERACEARVGDRLVTFVKEAAGRVLLATYTDQPLDDVRKDIWLSPGIIKQDSAIRPSATQDWAFVHDQNQDGKIDHIAFLIGPLPVQPEDTDVDLPKLANGIHLSKSEMRTLLTKTRFGFWQGIDLDFDGSMDALAIPAQRKANGWYRGWALSEAKAPGGKSDCQILGPEGQFEEVCEVREAERDIVSRSASAHLWARHPQAIFGAIRSAGNICRFAIGELPR